MLSEFGKLFRKMRIDRDLTMGDVAASVGVRPAFISAIETGRKPAPAGFLEGVANALNLSQHESRQLTFAAAQQAKEVTVSLNGRSDQAKELAVAFARKFETISEADIARLLGDL
jgi:transcriptional regulator with XRE-family HTH domain